MIPVTCRINLERGRSGDSALLTKMVLSAP